MTAAFIPENFVPPGRRLVRAFVDVTTGYEVIEHIGEGEKKVCVTLVDSRTGEIVPIERRAEEIPKGEQVRLDEALGLRVTTRHLIDLATGLETLLVEITDAKTGVIASRGESSALRSAADRSDPMAAYLAHKAAQREEEAFWRDEYPVWSFDKRFAYWDRAIRRQMRSQAEWGLDEYAMFTPENFATWRSRDAEIDRILDEVLKGFDASDRAAIEHRLGREVPKKSAPKKSRPRRRSG